MKIFKDIFSGDELFSDSYPIREIDDIVYEVTGKVSCKYLFVQLCEYRSRLQFIVEKEGDYGITANKEEDDESEGAAAGFEATEKRVIDIVSAHRLSETSFDKVLFIIIIIIIFVLYVTTCCRYISLLTSFSLVELLAAHILPEELHGIHQNLHAAPEEAPRGEKSLPGKCLPNRSSKFCEEGSQ